MESLEKKYYTVTTKELVSLMLQHIEEHEEIAFDTEDTERVPIYY